MSKSAREIQAALSAPIRQEDVDVKPGPLSNGRAMVIFYIDARTVMDRLDEAVGCNNWQDEYDYHPDGSVSCQLRVRIDGEWITKSDVGGMSEQPDGGDRAKAAVSDALKRTAVKWGIGRFLYSLPVQWADYDPQKKRFVSRPQLPASLYKKVSPQQRQEAPPAPVEEEKPRSATTAKHPPKDGVELLSRLQSFEADLVRRGRCKAGEVITEVEREVKKNSMDPKAPASWPVDLVQHLYKMAAEFGKPVGSSN